MRTIFGLSTFIIVISLSWYSCNSSTEKRDTDEYDYIHNLTVSLDSIGQEIINNGQVMGLSMAVAKKGEIIYENGFGYIDSAQKQKATPESIFLMASISKLIGATMTMKLVEEGKLSLESKLADLLPDYPNRDQANKITLKQLLDHTAGLKDYASVIDSIYMLTQVDPTFRDYYKFFENNELDFVPSTHFNYSNSGYILLAKIIEKATGNSYEDELDRIINEPTGLHIKHLKENVNNPRLTSFFQLQDSALIFQPHWTWIKGDGGLTTTASELAKFPFYWSDGTIISKESFEIMCKPSKVGDNLSTGYGIGVRTGKFEGEKVVGHTGGDGSSHGVMQFYPEKETSIVVFVNTDDITTDAIYIIGPVALAVLQKEKPVLKVMEIQNEDLSRFLGDYEAINSFYGGSGKISIVQYDGDPNLYRKRTNSDSKGQRLFYLGNNEFSYEPYPMDRVIFQVDNEGNVLAYTNLWNGMQKSGLFKKQN